MTIKRIGNETRDASRKLESIGWSRAHSYNRGYTGKVRETRAELACPVFRD